MLVGIFLAGLGVCWTAQRLGHSSILTISGALIIGFLSQGIDLKFDPLFDPRTNSAPISPTKRDKTIWIALFLPPVAVLGAVLTYLLDLNLNGLELFRAILIAMLLGSIVAATTKMLFYDKRSNRNVQDRL